MDVSELGRVLYPGLVSEDDLNGPVNVVQLVGGNSLSELFSERQLVESDLLNFRVLNLRNGLLVDLDLRKVLRNVQVHVVAVDHHKDLSFDSHLLYHPEDNVGGDDHFTILLESKIQ